MSHQKDGFNVIVIDKTLRERNTTYFRWLTSSDNNEFRTFSTNIKSNSIIIIVFQKMCASFETNWYTKFAKDANITIGSLHTDRYDIAIIVACKNECPANIEGDIPYSYYGQLDEYSVSLALKRNY